MFVLQSYRWAVVFCVITMFCWGSWANTQKLARKGWRFELFYWDYVIGVLLLTLLLGLTLGSHGTAGRRFWPILSKPRIRVLVQRCWAAQFSTWQIFFWSLRLISRECRWHFRWGLESRWFSAWF